MRPRFTLACVLLQAIVHGAAVNAEVVEKPGFSLTLPEGWVEIPQEVLAQMHEGLKLQAPGATIPHYDYGFQRTPGPDWLAYPYVLVQVLDTGRLPEYELHAVAKIDLNKTADKQADDLKSIMSDAKIGQMQYDEAAHVIWMPTQSEIIGFGQVKGLSGMIPTEKGMLQIHGYCVAADFPDEVETFRRIVKSAQLSPELVYQPRWSDRSKFFGIDWSGVGTQALIGGVVGGLAAIFGLLMRKRKKPPEQPAE